MKLKNWEQFNELRMSTYQSAADKLRTKHPGRADKITAHGKDIELSGIIDDLGDKQIDFFTQDKGMMKVRVNQLDVDKGSRNTMAITYGSLILVHVDFLDQENPVIKTNIQDRKSANIVVQILRNWFNKQNIGIGDISTNDVYDSGLGT